MKLLRRQFLHLAAMAGALPCANARCIRARLSDAPGADYCRFRAGQHDRHLGSPDRSMAVRRSSANRSSSITGRAPAAMLGTEAVVNSAADGYTLLMVAPANTINMSLYDKLSFDFMHDMAPVSGIVRVPNVLRSQSIASGQHRSRIHRLCEKPIRAR